MCNDNCALKKVFEIIQAHSSLDGMIASVSKELGRGLEIPLTLFLVSKVVELGTAEHASRYQDEFPF